MCYGRYVKNVNRYFEKVYSFNKKILKNDKFC